MRTFFRKINKFNNDDNNRPRKCFYLVLWVCEKGRKVISTWNMTDAKQKVVQTYHDRFQAYAQPKSSPLFARYKLHNKVQEPGETRQQFVTTLKLLVKDCEYGQAENDEVDFWGKDQT